MPNDGEYWDAWDNPHELLRKAKQSQQFRKTLIKQFMDWDSSVGAESDLNCLDITNIAQDAINQYLKEREKDHK